MLTNLLASTRAPLWLMAGALALGGCTDVRKAAGWDKNPPDEFRVVSRAPLSLPPDFGLRPPTPGAPRPQEGSTTDQARNAVTGGRTPQRTSGAGPAASIPVQRQTQTAGEAALLSRAGADRIDPTIRNTVDREASAVADADRSFTDRLIFWRQADPPGTVVDPEREQQRIRENQALGRAPTDGDTPIIMIGAGTGVAPYRAFVEERVERGDKGKSWLVFGERNFTNDFLYQLEWQDHLASDALSRIDVAFSRDQPEKIYVQHRLWEQRADINAWIADGAHIYVCGDEKGMAKDVDATLAKILAEPAKGDEEAGRAKLKELSKAGRYQRDVY